MYLPLFSHSKRRRPTKPPERGLVTPLPIAETDLKARLVIRIADGIERMGLNVSEINACVRIGQACLDQGYTLIGAYDHAVKVARRIITVKQRGGIDSNEHN